LNKTKRYYLRSINSLMGRDDDDSNRSYSRFVYLLHTEQKAARMRMLTTTTRFFEGEAMVRLRRVSRDDLVLKDPSVGRQPES